MSEACKFEQEGAVLRILDHPQWSLRSVGGCGAWVCEACQRGDHSEHNGRPVAGGCDMPIFTDEGKYLFCCKCDVHIQQWMGQGVTSVEIMSGIPGEELLCVMVGHTGRLYYWSHNTWSPPDTYDQLASLAKKRGEWFKERNPTVLAKDKTAEEAARFQESNAS